MTIAQQYPPLSLAMILETRAVRVVRGTLQLMGSSENDAVVLEVVALADGTFPSKTGKSFEIYYPSEVYSVATTSLSLS